MSHEKSILRRTLLNHQENSPQEALTNLALKLLEGSTEFKSTALLVANVAFTLTRESPSNADDQLSHHSAELIAKLLKKYEQTNLSDAYGIIRDSQGSSSRWSRLKRNSVHHGVLIALLFMFISSLGTSFLVDEFDPRLWFKPRYSGFIILSNQQGYGKLGLGVGADGKNITVNGKAETDLIGVHARSETVLQFNSNVSALKGACAYPDTQTLGKVVCSILRNGKIVFESKVLSAKNRVDSFEVSLDQSRRLELRVDSATKSINNAHGVWMNLKGIP